MTSNETDRADRRQPPDFPEIVGEAGVLGLTASVAKDFLTADALWIADFL